MISSPEDWADIDIASADLLTLIAPQSPPSAALVATLPIRYGGLGLRSCKRHCPACYTAGAAAASVLMPHLVTDASMLPRQAPRLTSQRALSEALDAETIRSLIDGAKTSKDFRFIARLTALAAKGVGMWLSPSPEVAHIVRLTAAECRMITCYRLGAPICNGKMRCPKCILSRVDIFGDHALTCMAGGARTAIHHSIRDVVLRMARTALLRPAAEPSSGQHSRADLSVWISNRLVTFDFVVAAPLREPLAVGPKRAVDHAEKTKQDHLDKTDQKHVQPIALDMLGGYAIASRAALTDIARAYAARHEDERTNLMAFWAHLHITTAKWTATELARAALEH
jgi:hypothetical protein